MTDNEKILTWLGYVNETGTPAWVKHNAGTYVAVIGTDRERLFLHGTYGVDPELDYLVLQRVRSCIFSSRKRWHDDLLSMWRGRLNIASAVFADAMLAAYIPGDYAEAARFLWESHASLIEHNDASSPRPAGATS